VPAPKAPIGRADKTAWLITGPLLAVGIALTLPVVLSGHAQPSLHNVEYAPVLLLFAVLASRLELRLDIRRQGGSIWMNDVPMLLSLFYLSPLLAIMVRVLAGLIWNVFSTRLGPHKTAFNAASQVASVAAANLVIFQAGLGPATKPDRKSVV